MFYFFWQVMVLLGGLVFLSTGLLIIGHGFSRRISGKRVVGRIAAVRGARNGLCYPVYEYHFEGRQLTYPCPAGTRILGDILPGSRVCLILDREDPQLPMRPSPVPFIISLVFAAVSSPFFYAAYRMDAFQALPAGLALGLMGVLALKFWVFYRKGKTSAFGWRQVHRKKQAAMLNETEILEPKELDNRLAAYNKRMWVYAPILILIAVVMIGCGGLLWQNLSKFYKEALPTIGVVTGLAASPNESAEASGANYSYHAVITFETEKAENITFSDKISASPPIFDVGTEVDVLYDPANPKEAIVNRHWFNWLPAALVLLNGLVLMFVAWQIRPIINYKRE